MPAHSYSPGGVKGATQRKCITPHLPGAPAGAPPPSWRRGASPPWHCPSKPPVLGFYSEKRLAGNNKHLGARLRLARTEMVVFSDMRSSEEYSPK